MLLQHAQDLGLRARAHVADLVEEEAAAVGLLEAADPLLVGAGERALLVAEELGFEQVLLERRAVHLDEVPARAQRVVVDGAGDELLAGARLAADQHRRVALRHLLHDAEHALQRAARADDAVEVVDVVLRVAEVVELVAHAPELERLLDLDLHLLDLERLLHVVEGADLHRLDRRAHRSERGHQDDGGRGMEGLGRLEHLEAVAAAHLEVAQDDVEVALVQPLDGRVAVGRLVELVAGLGERPDQPPPQGVVIVCNQDATHRSPSPAFPLSCAPGAPYSNHWPREPEMGSVTVKRVPRPAADAMSMRPSCASTILRTIARPSPDPCALVVKNGLKILSTTSGGTPGPSSVICTTIVGTCVGPCGAVVFLDLPVLRRDADVPPPFHRLEGVDDQVREDLAELVAVGVEQRQVALDRERHLDVAPPGLAVGHRHRGVQDLRDRRSAPSRGAPAARSRAPRPPWRWPSWPR